MNDSAVVDVREFPSIERPLDAARPLVCGEAEDIAAFYHPPVGPSFRKSAVLLCNPIGWEAIASHRAYRHLAELLAREGYPVLRFDYPGTGDSAGGDEDPDRVEAWRRGIRDAIAALRRVSGAREVSLIGVHLGATLAALAALETTDVSSLVLWGPYTKGRAYVREGKAYRALNEASSTFPRAEDQGGLEVAGFVLTASTLAELSKLDLLADRRSPAPHVLLLSRGEGGDLDPLGKHFEAAGAKVVVSTAPGYAPMMQEPRKSVVPHTAFETIARYLNEIHPPAAERGPFPPVVAARRMKLSIPASPPIREEAITYGPAGRFFGILTLPDEPRARRNTKPCVLFLTTASHHRVGPNRMYVPLARTLAARGFVSLRFDLTGVGDSPTVAGVSEGHGYSKEFVGDVQAAMDHLGSLGFRRFVPVGLCSGAYLGFHAALADPRIAGEVLINPQTFNWREGDSLEMNRRVQFMSTRFYRRSLLDPRTWKRGLRGEINLRAIGKVMLARARMRLLVESRRALRSLGMDDQTDRIDVADAFQTLVRRENDVLLIYSGNDEGLDYLSTEVGSRLRRLSASPTFKQMVIDGPDHTFTPIWAQGWLRKSIVDHLLNRFG